MSVFAGIALGVFVGLYWIGRGPLGPVWLLPVTLAHELAHWIVAVSVGARPSLPRLWPKKQADGSWLLGSVEFQASGWSTGVIGLAPLLLLPLGMWLLTFESVTASVVAGGLFAAARPSPQDWVLAVKAPLGAIAVLIPTGGVVLHGTAPLFP